MMTLQTPQTMWNPTAPAAGVNGHSTRIADVFGGVTPQGYALGGIPTPVVNPFFNYVSDVTAMNPYAAVAAQQMVNPYAVNPFVVNPLSVNPLATINPFAAVNPFAAINPLAAVNPYICGCTPAAFGSFVNPLALNPFAAINPFAAVNPIALNPLTMVNPLLATIPQVTPTIAPLTTTPINALNTTLNPFVAGAAMTNPINSMINTIAPTIPGVSVNPLVTPNLTAGITNPLVSNIPGITHPAVVNPLVTGLTTLNPLGTTPFTTTPFMTTPYLQGIQPTWTGGAFPGVFSQGVTAFPYDPFLGSGFATHPHYGIARGLCGTSTFPTINPFVTNSRVGTPFGTNPYLANAITTNPLVANPYLTNPYLTNSIAAATALNPWLRSTINHPFASACGLNPLGATLGVC